MASAGGSGPPEILSTHPSPASRIRELQEMSQRVMPLYESRRQGR